MDQYQAQELGRKLLARRSKLGLTARKVAEMAGLEQPTYTRIETGQFANPRPDKLVGIAHALDLPASDLFALAGYSVPNDLPSFTPYLRTKFRDLPTEDIARIQAYATRLARKHGVNIAGPKPGEDET